MHGATTVRILVAAVLVILAAAGCGGDDEEASPPKPLLTSVVGRVEGLDAFIGMVSYRNGDVIGYVCDGKRLGEVVAGSAAEGEIELVSDTGAKVAATLSKDRASGTFTTSDGEEFDFTAARSTGNAGVYRALDKVAGRQIKGGWIVLPSGEQRGLVRVDGAPRPGPAIQPSKPTVSVTGVGVVQVQQATPSASAGVWGGCHGCAWSRPMPAGETS